MKMPVFAYHRPESVSEAVQLLDQLGPEAKVLAGGQSMLPLMALRLSRPEHLVDIGRIAELDQIRPHDGGVAIGALVRHGEAELSDLVARSAPMVAAALPHVGHKAIRNRGTVCGSLAHSDPAAEMPAVTLALDAEFVAQSVNGQRIIAATDFFHGYLTTALAANELLTEVRFPAWPDGAGASVVELSRRHGDYALVGLAAMLRIDDGVIAAAALSFFSVSSVPVRVGEAEASLIGQSPTPEAFEEASRVVSAQLDPPDDNHASAAYRSHTAGVLTQRALTEAAHNTKVRA